MFLVRETTNAWLTDFGLNRYIPMMISRMIISLKKAACFKTHIIMDDQNSLPMNLQDYHRSHREESIRLSPLTE